MNKEDLLNKYFEQTLTDKEKILFEQLLEEDADFQEEFNFQNDVKLAMTLNEREKLKAQLKTHHSNAVSKWSWKYSIAMAAAVVLCFGLYSIFDSNPNPQQLFSQYYETYPNTISPIVRDANADSNLKQQAFEAYENKNFHKAENLFAELYATQGEEYALFYQIMSMMELNNDLDRAKSMLIETEWSEEFKEKSLWYLSMIHLKQNQKHKAKETLQQLNEIGDYRQKQVQELIKKL